MILRVAGLLTALALSLSCARDNSGLAFDGARRVGNPAAGTTVLPTGQVVCPAGDNLAYTGRPLDLVLSPDGRTVYVKDAAGLTIVDADRWTIRQRLPFSDKDDAGSMHGICVASDGRIFVTGAKKFLWQATPDARGRLAWSREIKLPGPKPKEAAAGALGVILSADNRRAFVCLSLNNTLGIVDLDTGAVIEQIDVGICPYHVVLSKDEQSAYVSNFGGLRPATGQKTAKTAGSGMLVDERGIGISGTISHVDLQAGKSIREIPVGLHPAGIAARPDGSRLYVANANSDSVSIIDTATDTVIEEISVRPDPNLPFGSITNAVALSADGKTLFAANAGNNAVAVIRLAAHSGENSTVTGFIPTAWFPGALAVNQNRLFIANVKGNGSRNAATGKGGAFDRVYNSKRYVGGIGRFKLDSLESLPSLTAQVLADSRVPQALLASQKARADIPPVPVPARVGEPSTIEHVVYVIKENRTYDQVLGDMNQGNGDPKLCIYGKRITPNHHAIAEQFVLLDNYYCNGVVSADGHQWATQGMVTSYQEKIFGGFVRSYDFGTDALCYASSNFIWDSVLLAGLSFRNYGEFDFPVTVPKDATWFDAWRDYKAGTNKIGFKQSIDIDLLKRYTSPIFPGWEMKISDQYRVDQFLKEFRESEKTGQWPSFILIYLPQDHTSGRSLKAPSPRAHLADNDLALGRLIDAISHSRFWPTTVVFVNEDDPQDGFDHVDGHRSLCLVASPYARRKQVIHQFYNQSSVLHTIARMLRLPPMNQQVAQSPVMAECFQNEADLSPYQAVPSQIALDEFNIQPQAMSPAERVLAEQAETMDLTRPDRINDDIFNKVLWQAERGIIEPYPAQFAGAHGKALGKLGLKLDRAAKTKDDDDDDK